MPDLGKLLDLLRGVIAPAARAFVRTLLVMIALSFGLAAAAFAVAAPASGLRGLLAAAIALITGVVVGVSLAGQRAAGAALRKGLTELKLGEQAVALVFERLPLAQAEARLREAVAALTGAAGEGGLRGWLLGKVRARLLEKVELVTLARFREAGQAEGGVDLPKVQGDLSGRADALLSGKVKGAVKQTTFVHVAIAVLLPLAVAVALRVTAG